MGAAGKPKEINIDQLLREHNLAESRIEISIFDIVESEEYKELCPTPESCGVKELETILFKFGMNTKKNYYPEEVTHRRWNGDVVTGTRWTGFRRRDKEWKELMKKTHSRFKA